MNSKIEIDIISASQNSVYMDDGAQYNSVIKCKKIPSDEDIKKIFESNELYLDLE